MATAYVACHRLKVKGQAYVRGQTVTVAEIGSPRLETTLKRLKWIVPIKEFAPVTEQASAVVPAPVKNKGGRPRRPA